MQTRIAIRGAAFVALMFWLVVAAVPGMAQQLGLPQAAILTISTDRVFSESRFGQRVAADVDAQGVILAAENRSIEAELTAEEKELTQRRPDMEAAAFRDLADAFDQKVQANRETQETKARALNQIFDSARVEFLQAVRPILETLMREAGAGVILERSSVFLSANATDITDLAIERIDAAIGDGSDRQVAPEQ